MRDIYHKTDGSIPPRIPRCLKSSPLDLLQKSKFFLLSNPQDRWTGGLEGWTGANNWPTTCTTLALPTLDGLAERHPRNTRQLVGRLVS